jgi:F-type H+-transporting ATPase subunit b
MISINATLVIQALNFLILMWILNRILFKPIFQIIEDRDRVVEESKAEIIRLNDERDKKTETVERQLSVVRKTANEERERIRMDANHQAELITRQATQKAEKHIDEVRRKAGEEADQARKDAELYRDTLVNLVFQKVMGRSPA